MQGQPVLLPAEELRMLITSGNQAVDKNKMDSSNWAEFGATSQKLQRHLPSQTWETKSSCLKSACGTAWVSVSITGSCPQILLPSQVPATCTWDSPGSSAARKQCCRQAPAARWGWELLEELLSSMRPWEGQ